MTLEQRLALAREIAARTKPRFVVDNSREEARQKRFAEAKRYTERLKRRTSRLAGGKIITVCLTQSPPLDSAAAG